MDKIEKPFSYDELFAVVYLSVARAILIQREGKFNTPEEGAELVEKMIADVIALRWDSPRKRILQKTET